MLNFLKKLTTKFRFFFQKHYQVAKTFLIALTRQLGGGRESRKVTCVFNQFQNTLIAFWSGIGRHTESVWGVHKKHIYGNSRNVLSTLPSFG